MATGYAVEQHLVSIRLRMQGSGEFHARLAALEDDPEQDLVDSTLAVGANRPVSLLSNIRAMRIQFHGSIDGIDEHFEIKNILFYAKPIASGYPQ
jgi:hypothetical protein